MAVGGRTGTFPFLKIERRCPLVLLVNLGWRAGKALGSELFRIRAKKIS
jgi:hypothetical protein